MINPTFPAVALIGACLLLPTTARANDYSDIGHYCFIVNSSGVVHNLTEMCSPSTQATAAVSVSESRSTLTGAALEEALNTGAFLHADTFCEVRARGGTKREADDAATSVLADYMISTGIPAEALSVEFIGRTDEISVQLCPELQPTGRYD
jgi:hypothetical protein